MQVKKQLLLATAKSFQSYPTLCEPRDCSPPGSFVSGILQARILEWVAISFSNAWKWKVKVKSLSRVRLLGTPWTAAYQAPPSMGFSWQEYWSGVPFPFLMEQQTGSKLGKEYHEGYILSPSLFNLYSEDIMRNAELYEAQAGIKIAGRNINNLRYVDAAATAAAKSLQSCPTLCDPIDSNPPGSPVPGILQARTLEWVAISFSNAWKWKVKVKLLSRVWLFSTQWTAAHQAPSSMGFPGNSTGAGCHRLLLICRWHHPYGRKRGTKQPLDESERGKWKSWLKTQHSENEDHGIHSHHFIANRWGNNGNSDRLYFGGLQNHWRWWLQPWN